MARVQRRGGLESLFKQNGGKGDTGGWRARGHTATPYLDSGRKSSTTQGRNNLNGVDVGKRGSEVRNSW